MLQTQFKVGDIVSQDGLRKFRITDTDAEHRLRGSGVEMVEIGVEDPETTFQTDRQMSAYWDKAGNHLPENIIPLRPDAGVYQCDDCGEKVELAEVDLHSC